MNYKIIPQKVDGLFFRTERDSMIIINAGYGYIELPEFASLIFGLIDGKKYY